jgi:uncharacterized membrane-anchored protein
MNEEQSTGTLNISEEQVDQIIYELSRIGDILEELIVHEEIIEESKLSVTARSLLDN